MSWVVLRQFADSQDDYRVYRVGDLFPRPGKAVSPTRIAELSGIKNAFNTPIIGQKTPKEPKTDKIEVEKKPESAKKKTATAKKKMG